MYFTSAIYGVGRWLQGHAATEYPICTSCCVVALCTPKNVTANMYCSYLRDSHMRWRQVEPFIQLSSNLKSLPYLQPPDEADDDEKDDGHCGGEYPVHSGSVVSLLLVKHVSNTSTSDYWDTSSHLTEKTPKLTFAS